MPLSRRAFLTGLAGVAGSAAVGAWALEQSTASSGSSHARPAGSPATSATGLSPSANLPNGKGVVVLVTLYGGNDGLNTVVPVGDPAYAALRGDLAVDATKALPLADGLALAPEMAGFKRLWDAGQLAIVRGVSYPNPNRSHFRSMDIWQSGDPAGVTSTGWLGRWLDLSASTPLDAVAVGSTLPLALAGERASAASVPTAGQGLRLTGATRDAWQAMQAADPSDPPLLARAAQSGRDLLQVATAIASVLDQSAASPDQPGTLDNGVPDPGPAKGRAASGLAAQLDTVARLITAGLPTRAYFTSTGGFDTHADEGPTHPALLSDLDAAVSGFFQRLATAAAPVVLVVYSEFGRRPAPDASGGTDHGVAAPVLVAGPSVKGGFLGDEPSLRSFDDNGDLRWNVDFRSIYATVLGDVLGGDPKSILPGATPPLLPLVRT